MGRRVPLAEASLIAEEVRKRLVVGRGRCRVVVVGSVRRRAPTVKDLDFLVVSEDVIKAKRLLNVTLRPSAKSRVSIIRSVSGGLRRRTIVLRVERRGRRPIRIKADLFAATPAEKPYALLHHTGPRDFNIRVRYHAKVRGLLLNQYGLYSRATKKLFRRARSEKRVLEGLGVTYLPPHKR